MNQLKTPLFDQLVLHSEKQPISFHVPGHKNGGLLPELGGDFLKLDLTELTGLDDLHSPEGIILEAEKLLADLYDTKQSYFLVNGSTAGNLAMILATIKRGDLVLVQRNSHKSIMNGIRLAQAKPVFLTPEYEQQSMVATGVSVESVKTALNSYPQAKALILTYPNYYGMVYNLKEIINLAHAHDIPVLIDEAHGVHFINGGAFPPSAVSFGADIVVQSAHKILPAMTMGAFIHFNSKIVSMDLDNLRYYLQVVQSSSPSYPIMASLDLARRYLGTFDKTDQDTLLKTIERFRAEINAIEGLSLLPVAGGDPLKMIVQPTGQRSGFGLQKCLENQGIYPELADSVNVLLVLPFLKAESTFPFEKAVKRIKRAAIELKMSEVVVRVPSTQYDQPKIVIPVVDYEEMAGLTTTFVPFVEAVGKICAETIIPYPPGIPMFLPGERIYKADLDILTFLLSQKAKIQGGEHLRNQVIKVFE